MQPITIERTRRIRAPRQHVFDTVVSYRTPGLWQPAAPDRDHVQLKKGDQLEVTVTVTSDPLQGRARVLAVWPDQYLEIQFHCRAGVTLEQQWFFADATEGASNVTVVTRIDSWDQPPSAASESVEAIGSTLEQILDAIAALVTRSSATR